MEEGASQLGRVSIKSAIQNLKDENKDVWEWAKVEDGVEGWHDYLVSFRFLGLTL